MFSPPVQSFCHPAAMRPPFHYAGAAPLQVLLPPAPVVPVREVWAGNLDAEVRFFCGVATQARFVAFAVHYPGVVHGATPPQADHNTLTVRQRYAAIKANADALKPLQVGLAVGTHDGRCLAWEFNLRGFDAATDPHAPGSVRYLEERGISLDEHRVRGIPMERLTDALHRSGLLRRGDVSWVCYAGAYHLAYLLKVIRGGLPLPSDMPGFLGVARRFLGGSSTTWRAWPVTAGSCRWGWNASPTCSASPGRSGAPGLPAPAACSRSGRSPSSETACFPETCTCIEGCCTVSRSHERLVIVDRMVTAY
ncbi:hypothetical protein C2845_PM09G13430 [Panicum miliaceum]|uniref:Uncharacterized protein n=1 Tax=Panicum miliaceum TaxID=4540 RepID=A0A3L6S386_PANMI|nr:hypothetical protein C2845_PM09G13430 [Panicum miliaceum]